MTDKELFIAEIEQSGIQLSPEAQNYFNSLKVTKVITEKGEAIMDWFKVNNDKPVPAKVIAEALGLTSRSVSGTMRKLVAEGFVIKEGRDPVYYNINKEKN